MRNKKGVSGVIAVIILIGLTMAVVAIVWTVVNGLVSDRLEESESCFGNFEKVTLNNRYTCYNTSSSQFKFSINIGDIDIDSVIVFIGGEGETKSYTITSTATTISGLTNYTGGSSIVLPDKNGGLTYISSGYSASPDYIEIAPVMNGKQCGTSDSIQEIYACSLI